MKSPLTFWTPMEAIQLMGRARMDFIYNSKRLRAITPQGFLAIHVI
jgi:hypothetical protein